jgi:hypothetical protein
MEKITNKAWEFLNDGEHHTLDATGKTCYKALSVLKAANMVDQQIGELTKLTGDPQQNAINFYNFVNSKYTKLTDTTDTQTFGRYISNDKASKPFAADETITLSGVYDEYVKTIIK